MKTSVRQFLDSSIWKTAKWLIIVVPLALSACIEIVAVHQPDTGQVNVPFEIQLDGESNVDCDATDGCPPFVPMVFASIPADWVVESCTYTGGIAGTCLPAAIPLSTEAILDAHGPTDPTAKWHAWAGESIDNDVPSGTKVTVVLRVRPTTTGAHALDYVLGIEKPGLEGIDQDDFSMEHPITIGVAAVPAIGAYGYALLVLLVAGAAVVARGRSRS